MTIAEAIYDVYEIARMHGKEKDIPEELVLQKLNSYCSAAVTMFVSETGVIPMNLYQNHHPIDMVKITSGDDPLLTLGSITLGKGKLASMTMVLDGRSTLTVTKWGRIHSYSWLEPETLMNLIISGEEFHPDYGYCFLSGGTDLYVYPYIEKVAARGVFEDPSKIRIQEAGAWRNQTIDDPYPRTLFMVQDAILQLLTKDFKIMEEQISDTLNDGQTKLNILSSLSPK